MKDKKITLTVSNISTKQWSSLVLELNIMRKAWAKFGPEIKLAPPGLNRIVSIGTSNKHSENHEHISSTHQS